MNKTLLLIIDEGPDGFPAAQAAEELQNLCYTAGIGAGAVSFVKVRQPNPATFLGKGKRQDLSGRIGEEGVTTVVLNRDLSATQLRNLAAAWNVTVIDRTSLILNIFSRHARSSAGKLQVALARENYRLSQLSGKGVDLSRLGGGIGTRGPGEMKLEEDRRQVRNRIRRLNREITALEQRRRRSRERYARKLLPEMSLVGYTNAGKSSLLNALCGKREVLVADKLFSTLDPITRRVHLKDGKIMLATDTVGFLHDLPHALVAAFHATLEGLREADLLGVVLDGHSAMIAEHYHTVVKVLAEVSAAGVPRVLIINKTDLLVPEEITRLSRKFPEAVPVSSRTGEGIPSLKQRIKEELYRHG